MIYVAGSAALTVLQLGAQLLTARLNRWGWVLRIIVNVAAIPYDLVTRQYFFTVAAIAGIVVAARAFRGWSCLRPRPASAPR